MKCYKNTTTIAFNGFLVFFYTLPNNNKIIFLALYFLLKNFGVVNNYFLRIKQNLNFSNGQLLLAKEKEEETLCHT